MADALEDSAAIDDAKDAAPAESPRLRQLSPGIKPLLVLSKIRGILDAFSLAQPALTLSELRAATEFPTSTVQRLVANLVARASWTATVTATGSAPPWRTRQRPRAEESTGSKR
jgi:hypothetical protein